MTDQTQPESATAATAIKPCPFCGGEAEAGSTVVWWVICLELDCGGEGPLRNTKAQAIDAWNTRVPGGAA